MMHNEHMKTTPNPSDAPQWAPVCSGSPRFAGAAPQRPEAAAAAALDSWRTLLRGHAHDPVGALRSVQGDFAIALALDDGSIFLAVDRFSTRSLCWRVEAGHLRVAERADQLGATEVDPQALFDYLYFHVIPAPRTAWRGVHRLPAGHCGLWRDGQMTVQPYWTAAFDPQHQPRFEALRDEFRDLLKSAVSRELDGGVPACFLSGGTDSSTVTGMVCQAAGRPAVAYTIGFEAEGYDEMAFARVAAQHFGAEHREIYYKPEDLLRDIPVVAGGYDQPFGNSSALPSFHASNQARQDGVHRILAGDGGDELFGGNSRYATQKLFDHYHRLPGALRHGLLEPLFGLPAVAQAPLLRKGASYIRQATTPMPDRMQDYNLLRRLGPENILTPQFLAQVRPESVNEQQRTVWSAPQQADEFNRHLAYDWRYTLAECDLPKVVGTTGLAGLSVGFPMLDADLVAFSARLPLDYKLRGQSLRWFFKEALRGFLPDDVITKKKQGFGLPFGVWMVQHEGLKALAQDALAALVDRGLVRADFRRSLLDEHLPAHPHYYGTMVWILIMLEHWLRRHAPQWKLDAGPGTPARAMGTGTAVA